MESAIEEHRKRGVEGADLCVVRGRAARALRGQRAPPGEVFGHGTGQLVAAAESGEDEIVRLLVDAGADVNTHGGAVTALVAAIERRDLPLITFLEDHGAREKP